MAVPLRRYEPPVFLKFLGVLLPIESVVRRMNALERPQYLKILPVDLEQLALPLVEV